MLKTFIYINMAIKYSLPVAGDPRNLNTERKVNARVQSIRTVGKEEFAKYAARHYGHPMDHIDILAAIERIQLALVDYLRDGNQVSLGELGTFYSHIDGRSVPMSEYEEKGFHPSRDINDVNVKWKPSAELKSLAQYGPLEFQRCALVEARKEKMRESKIRPDLR